MIDNYKCNGCGIMFSTRGPLTNPNCRDCCVALVDAGYCSGIILDTFIVCGEGGNYCSEACYVEAQEEVQEG